MSKLEKDFNGIDIEVLRNKKEEEKRDATGNRQMTDAELARE